MKKKEEFDLSYDGLADMLGISMEERKKDKRNMKALKDLVGGEEAYRQHIEAKRVMLELINNADKDG